jgi:hypothetical protein
VTGLCQVKSQTWHTDSPSIFKAFSLSVTSVTSKNKERGVGIKKTPKTAYFNKKFLYSASCNLYLSLGTPVTLQLFRRTFMGVVHPTFESFIYWFKEFKSHRCTKDYARQMVGFHQTKWYKLCRDYERGEDISKYFDREES